MDLWHLPCAPRSGAGASLSDLSLSETLSGWQTGANRVMLIPDGRRSQTAVDCTDQLISLESAA